MVYRKVKRMHPKNSHHKDNLFYFLSIVCIWDDSWAYCGNHFTIYVNQTITLYALNLPNDVHQLFLNKTGGNKRKGCFWKVCLVSLGVLTSILQRNWVNRIHIYTYICVCVYIYIGIPHFIAFCLIMLCKYCVFSKLKVHDHPAFPRSTSIIFPAAFAHFVSLCYSSVISAIFQTLHQQKDYDSLKAQVTAFLAKKKKYFFN